MNIQRQQDSFAWRLGATHPALKDRWKPGEKAHFEYHCNQSPDSPDYYLWQHTQQPVTVLSQEEDDPYIAEGNLLTAEDRGEAGVPRTYRVRFADGVEGPVFEDELYTHPKYYEPQYAFREENRHDR